MQWIVAQVQADGSLLNEQQSIATILQDRSEAALTLKLLASLPSGLSGAVAGDTEEHVEFLARKVIALASNGWDASAAAATLLAFQHTSGGFGAAPDSDAGLSESAWAVLALAQTNQASGAAVSAARNYLISKILPDGSVDARGDRKRKARAALTLLALQTSADPTAVTATHSLASWLLQQQSADGSWNGDIYLTAFAWSALFPVTADATVRANVRNFLLAKQSADGSWNGDPFLTALAVRALSGVASPPPAQSGGTVRGVVVDTASNAPLSGVAVTLSGTANANASAITDSAGKFSLSGLAAGSYAIHYSRAGYNGAAGSGTVSTSAALDLGVVGLSQLASSGIVRGVVSDSKGLALTGVAVSLGGAASMQAVTDSGGRYEMVGVAPGKISLSAALSGYQVAVGAADLLAGQTLVFSPTLYKDTETPFGTVRLSGRVAASGSGTALAGVAVQASGAAGSGSALSAADGKFELTLPAGSYSVAFALAGYKNVTMNVVGAAGAVVDAGVVSMAAAVASSSLRGKVLDAAGAAVAGAAVQIVGGASATSAADGTYLLEGIGIGGTAVTVKVSANGYQPLALDLQINQPGEIHRDFTLAGQRIASVEIGEVRADPTTAGSYSKVVASAAVTNTGANSGSVVVTLQVLDAGGKVVGSGIAFDGSGNLLGQLALEPGQQVPVRLEWDTVQQPNGVYTLNVRLLEPGSVTSAEPNGVLLAERAGSVTVNGQGRMIGSVTADPPVMQAGMQTVVKLSATLQNKGNAPLAAQEYTLKAVDKKNGAVVQSWVAAGADLAVNGVQKLAFPDWKPISAGDFRLDLSAADPALGTVSGSAYVGDAATASYTASRLAVPSGTQSVRGKIEILGQNVAKGQISDPLAPLVKAAINSAVAYNDTTAAAFGRSNNCYACHIQAQAVVGGELSRKFTPKIDEASRLENYRKIKAAQTNTGSFAIISMTGWKLHESTSSMFAMWGLAAWHDRKDAILPRTYGADYLAAIQAADGSWNHDIPLDHSPGWVSANPGGMVLHTAFNTKILADLLLELPDRRAELPELDMLFDSQVTRGETTLGSYQSRVFEAPELPLGNGHFRLDAEGNIYTSGGGRVVRTSKDGTAVVWSGLSNPQGLLWARDGGMLVCTDAGVVRLGEGGAKTAFSALKYCNNMVYGPDGLIYAAVPGGDKIARMDSQGVATDYFLPRSKRRRRSLLMTTVTC